MIKYTLHCSNFHQFDSWFSSSEAFDKLKDSKLLSCELCGDTSVSKSVMAPSVKKKKDAAIKGALLKDTLRENNLIEPIIAAKNNTKPLAASSLKNHLKGFDK